MAYPRYTNFIGSKHLNNLTYNESKKELGSNFDPNLLGSEHLNNLTHNEGKAVYLKNIEKELGSPRDPNLLGSQHLKNLG